MLAFSRARLCLRGNRGKFDVYKLGNWDWQPAPVASRLSGGAFRITGWQAPRGFGGKAVVRNSIGQLVSAFGKGRRSFTTRRHFSTNKPELEEQVLKSLSVIIDPDLKKDIVSLGFIKQLTIEDGVVAFDLELTTPACPVKEKFVEACNKVLKELDWVNDVKVNLTAQERNRTSQEQNAKSLTLLKDVKYIVAVASCKGGVGKSSVCVNLAYALQKSGAKVGILDADIYGPSLPSMVNADLQKQQVMGTQEGNILPFENDGMSLMSMGFLRPDEYAALRGPMAGSMVTQLLTGTNWGELDYLLIDMPPGTGDIHLSIAQSVPVDGAVIVTTPQQLSLIDVDKGIRMFDKVNIPSIAIVENMSYFQCDAGKKYDIFYRGNGEALALKYGIEPYFRLPLDPRVGIPHKPLLKDADASSPIVQEYNDLAESVVRSTATLRHEEHPTEVVTQFGGAMIGLAYEGEKWVVAARAVRLGCRSATMWDEWTNEKLFKDEDISQDVVVKELSPSGKYAVSIDWSDGHSSIMSHKTLLEICEKEGVQSSTA